MCKLSRRAERRKDQSGGRREEILTPQMGEALKLEETWLEMAFEGVRKCVRLGHDSALM